MAHIFPNFLNIGGTPMRCKTSFELNNTNFAIYYRDAGDWSIHVKYVECNNEYVACPIKYKETILKNLEGVVCHVIGVYEYIADNYGHIFNRELNEFKSLYNIDLTMDEIEEYCSPHSCKFPLYIKNDQEQMHFVLVPESTKNNVAVYLDALGDEVHFEIINGYLEAHPKRYDLGKLPKYMYNIDYCLFMQCSEEEALGHWGKGISEKTLQQVNLYRRSKGQPLLSIKGVEEISLRMKKTNNVNIKEVRHTTIKQSSDDLLI